MVIDLFFFSSRRRHTRLQGDWSSDVCSSDLAARNRQRIERVLRQPRQQGHRALAGPAAQEEQERPLAFIQALQRLHVRAATLGERERSTRRRPGRIERRADRWAAALEMLFGLLRGEALHPHGEPPWGGKADELPVREARLVEARGESRHQGMLKGGGQAQCQLLAPDSNQCHATPTNYYTTHAPTFTRTHTHGARD